MMTNFFFFLRHWILVPDKILGLFSFFQGLRKDEVLWFETNTNETIWNKIWNNLKQNFETMKVKQDSKVNGGEIYNLTETSILNTRM